MDSQTKPKERLLRLPAVLERVQTSRSTLWRWVAEGAFPKPYKLGPQTTVWKESEIDSYIERLGQ